MISPACVALRKDIARLEHLMGLLTIERWNDVCAFWVKGQLFSPDFNSSPPESWSNVFVHCAVVGLLARRLAEFSKRAGFVVDCEAVTYGALLHDWNKRLERIMQRDGGQAREMTSFNESSAAEVEQVFGASVAQLTISTGDIGCALFKDGKFGFENFIVFYADACTLGSRVVGHEERMTNSELQIKPGRRYARTEEFFRERFHSTWRDVNLEVIRAFEEFFVKKGVFLDSRFPCNLLTDWSNIS